MVIRYVGRKRRMARDLWSLITGLRIREFRECFCGSASFLWVVPPELPRWINDIDADVISFHRSMQSESGFIDRLIEADRSFATMTIDEAMRAYNAHKVRWVFYDDNVSYYILHQFAYGPIVRRERSNVCSFSFNHFNTRRGRTSRSRLAAARRLYQGVKITNNDYATLLDAPGQDVLLYLDPPYLFRPQSIPLYQHELTLQQHHELRDRLRNCRHRWLMTLSDHPEVRKLYAEFPMSYFGSPRMPLSYRPEGCRYELAIRNF